MIVAGVGAPADDADLGVPGPEDVSPVYTARGD